jgi:hypothetical protein
MLGGDAGALRVGGRGAVRGNKLTEMSAVSVENLYRMYADPSYQNICLSISTVRLGPEHFSTDTQMILHINTNSERRKRYFLFILYIFICLEARNILRFIIFMNRQAHPYSSSQMYLTIYCIA